MKKLELSTSVQYVKGVGPKLGEILGKNGIFTVKDLIENFPRTYEDRRAHLTISQLKENQLVSLKVQVLKIQTISLGKSYKKIYDVSLKDATGVIHCKYFRIPYKGYFDRFKPFDDVRVVGKVTNYKGRLEFHHADLRDIDPDDDDSDEILPVYVEMDGISSYKWQKLILNTVMELEKNENYLNFETLPKKIRISKDFLGYHEAVRDIHQPKKENLELYIERKSKAQKRFIFEEFFLLELFLLSKKNNWIKKKSLPFKKLQKLKNHVLDQISFKLTEGQIKAINDIEEDFLSGVPMHRLVQGDVGCGKTLVSFLAAVLMIENAYQVAMMVPTEILAEQHFKSAIKLLGSVLGANRISILTGKTKDSERERIHESLLSGETQFLIGTHALIEPEVQFKNLNLVIIDEQHRFGVKQRTELKQKGINPHFLIMTATPIPRTLSLTIFGDLDVSVIKELPVGRSPIQTRAAFQNYRQEAYQFLKAQVLKGRQGYVIFPLVEESEKIDLKNATDEFEKCKKDYPDIRWALLHGKMKSFEKEEIMEQFRSHQIDVLVSTTVVEVGVDVPNANIILIEHSERFGLSQLHQLRGRVGRGEHKSFCILLMGHAVSEESKQRIQFMESTTDGFKLAEFDLELRGPGEFLGKKQSGIVSFKMADLIKDTEILMDARSEADKILKEDVELSHKEHLHLREYLNLQKDKDIG